MKGRVHSFETMGALDGPGIRFIVFMQGCTMACLYCHNPDTWNPDSGCLMDSEQVVKKALRYKSYFANGGGVTLSGGEPLLQPQFCGEILKRLREEGVHTAIDTSGACFNNAVKEALDYGDLIILDLKHTAPEKFKELTGREIDNTLSVLNYVTEKNIPLWVRQVIIPGINDTREDVLALKELLKPVKNLEKIELLPYHTLGIDKWHHLGMEYKLLETLPPSKEKMEYLKGFLAS